jgi:mono/diheme cytochrome c family protein
MEPRPPLATRGAKRLASPAAPRSTRPASLALVPLALLLAAAAAAGCGAGGPDGAKLYRANCVRCHGEDGKGDRRSVGLYPNLDLTASRLAHAGVPGRRAIYQRIYGGEGAMPAFGDRLSPEDTEALVEYVLHFSKGTPGKKGP